MSVMQEQLNKCIDFYKISIEHNPLLKILDIFSAALVAIAALQCVFMIIIRDTFPFNAFLAGFIICVSQFVLNVSLRLGLVKYGYDNKERGERKLFVEYVICSLVLHFISLHFIN
ncbi:hypothetical protein QEN19_000791 [Hanseniaspora menglaensis]